MSTVKADNFTWKTGEATAQVGSSVTGPQIVYGVTKSWLNYTGATPLINRSYNISSVTKNSAGNYTLNYSTAFSDSTYATSITGGLYAAGYPVFVGDFFPLNRTTSAYNISAMTYNTASYTDPLTTYVTVIR